MEMQKGATGDVEEMFGISSSAVREGAFEARCLHSRDQEHQSSIYFLPSSSPSL